MGVLVVQPAQREQPQAVVSSFDVDLRTREFAQQPCHRNVGIGGRRAELLAVGSAGELVLVEAMQVGGVRRIDADFQRLQPIALDQALEGEGVRAGRQKTIEVGKGRCFAVAEIGEDDAVLHHDRVGTLPYPLAEHAALGLGGSLQALAVDVEQPAMEQAAQAAVLQASVGEVGAAVRAVAVQEAVAAALVAEQHEVLAEHAHGLGGTFPGKLVGERHRMPIVPHQRAAFGARPDAGDQLVLLGTHHGKRVAQIPTPVIRGRHRPFGHIANPVVSTEGPLDFARGRLRPERRDLASTISGF